MMSKNTILLVDDNPDDVLLTLYGLKEANCNATIAIVNGGIEALDYLFGKDACSPLPKLIILDLNMPGLGGLELLERMRNDERLKALPVVIITGSHDEKERLRSYSLGVSKFFKKPIRLKEITEILQYACLA